MSMSGEINPRFASEDVRDEPSRMLRPISGYEKQPLVSLEDAVKPLYHIVDDLPRSVWIAKESCEHPCDGLTSNESAAIYLYTMEWDIGEASLYAYLNRALREADRRKLVPWFPYLKLLLTALYKLPSVQDTVWRGVREDLSLEYQPGKKKAWWALSSCTATVNVLELPMYVGTEGKRTIFSIQCLNGKMIRQHSYFQKEDEILLLPGTYLEVVSQMSPATDCHIIHLKEKLPLHLLLEPPFSSSSSDASASATVSVVAPNFIQSFKLLGAHGMDGTGVSDEENENDCFEHASDTSTDQSVVKTQCFIWLDENVNKDQVNLDLQIKLRKFISLFEVFDVLTECERYIQHTKTKQIVLIVGGEFGHELVPRIHDLSQLLAVYVYCMDKLENVNWANKYKK
ncbi:unnamed protein product, partial [Didymodactylos carnosus]